MSMTEQTIIKADSYAHERNKELLEKEERELEALLKGEQPDEEAEDNQEPDSESVEDKPVQAESSAEQEEEPQSEAQEEPELSAEEKTFKQRYGDLRRHTQDKEKEFSAKLEKLEAQLTAATKNELVLPKSTDEVDAWAKKYPDVAGIVEAIAEKKASERATDLEDRMKEFEELRSSAKREKAEAELSSYHPDFSEIRADDKFHNWAKEQPKWVQDALYENTEDAKSVARVIDLYKVDNKIITPKKTGSDKAAASSVKGKSRSTPEADESKSYLSESAVAKMSLKEYEKRMDEIMEAQRSGKFIYDMA